MPPDSYVIQTVETFAKRATSLLFLRESRFWIYSTPMNFDTLVIQLLNGLVFSLLLFLMAAGLSLILGLMDVVNLAHGAFYLLGGYVGLSMIRWLGNFWLALLVAPLVAGAIGLLLQILFLRREHLGVIFLDG